MRKAFEKTTLVDSLGSDARRIWAASFTVDEHEAFGLAYRLLGGCITNDNAYLTCERRGFRRAGQGVIPRSWLHPFDVPPEQTIPTYHPKLLLVETPGGYELVVSTGNFASDDLRHTRNLAVHSDVSAGVAKSTAAWIERKPTDHRALCFVAVKGGLRVSKRRGNGSTFSQFVAHLRPCSACRDRGARCGEWVVAAPFWNPGALVKMLDREPEGRIEAYFRTRSVWERVAQGARASLGSAGLGQVAAYELREGGDVQRWHHKVVGWRCCPSRGAHSALYVGSANATMCGFFGLGKRAGNWESGVIWSGGSALWDYARSVARAGFSATRLSVPKERPIDDIRDEDEIGALDYEEMERLFATHLGRFFGVNRRSREIARYRSKKEVVRVLGCSWRLRHIRLRFEDSAQIRDGGLLKPGERRTVAKGARAQVHGVFERVSESDGLDLQRHAEATVDIAELDPEPERPLVTQRSAIASALAGLWWTQWGDGSGNGEREGEGGGGQIREDVRFPFAEYYALKARRPRAAAAWAERIATNEEPALERLPRHWRAIAQQLRGRA